MASELAHLALANRNHAILLHLLPDIAKYGDWIATIAFYKAVHVVEAAYAHTLHRHSTSHNDREQKLKTFTPMNPISRDYSHLLTASRIARYLEDGPGSRYATFTDFMGSAELKKLLEKRLYGVEQKSLSFLSDAGKKLLVKFEPSQIP